MTPAILAKLAYYRDHYQIGTGSILEVGSCDINGSPRSVFTHAKSYLGVDKGKGKGVDMTWDYTRYKSIDIEWGNFELVICCETIEHEPRFWKIIENLYLDCAPGGHIIISAPANGFPEHRHPVDCYRFMQDAFQCFYTTDECQLLDLSKVCDTLGHPGWIAIWKKC